MYKVFKVPGGWHVFYLPSPDVEPVLVPRPVTRPTDEEHKYDPYHVRQAAYRRVKKLNDLLKQTEEQIKRDGAIIL